MIPSGPSNARLMIVADCVSNRDLQTKTILSDREFDKMLSEAGVIRSQTFVTALIREQVNGQSFDTQVAQSKREITPEHSPLHDRYVRRSVLVGLDSLNRDIDLVKPSVILALGNGPLFTLCGKWGIKSWRGSILSYTSPGGHTCYVIPTYPPNYIYGVWKDRNIAIHDIRKAHEVSLNADSLQLPKYNFLLEPAFPEAAKTLQALLTRVRQEPTKLAVDIETRGGHITCIGVAWSALDAICLPLMRSVVSEMPNWQSRIHYWREEEETFLMFRLYQLLTHPNAQIIGQNFLYDAQYIYRHLHYVPNFKRDTMLAQHAMFSSMPKSLDFLSSLHTNYHVYWKNMHKVELKKEA